MNKVIRWFFVLLGIGGLIFVRMNEDVIFYDPFLQFFKLEAKPELFPAFDWKMLLESHLLRFFLNLIFSLLIIEFLFLRTKWTFQAMILLLSAQLLFSLIYGVLLQTEFSASYLFSFYVRRFVIQPVILLFIVPLYYFRLKTQ